MTEVYRSTGITGEEAPPCEVKGAANSRRIAGDALAAERRAEIERIGEQMFTVPSRSRAGRMHTVDVEKNGCTCEDRQLGGHLCAHLWAAAAVMLELEQEPEYMIRKIHNSRLGGHFDNTEYHLVETRGGVEVRTVSVSYSWHVAHLDRLDAWEVAS